MDEDYYTCRRCKHGSVGDCDKCEASYEEGVRIRVLDAAFNDGFSAAKEGFSISHCPISLSGEERIEWQKGWNDWTLLGE